MPSELEVGLGDCIVLQRWHHADGGDGLGPAFTGGPCQELLRLLGVLGVLIDGERRGRSECGDIPGRRSFCGMGASPIRQWILPSFLDCQIPAMYQVPMGIMAVWPVSNMVR